VEAELNILRIDKADRARHDERSAWPWVLCAVILLALGGWAWQWRSAAAAPLVQTIRVKPVERQAAREDRVVFNATGYVIAAHKIELASKVIGLVTWVGVEMGDKIQKDQILVRLEDDDYKARVVQQQGLLDNAKAMLAQLEAGSRPQEILTAKAKFDQCAAELANAQNNLKRLKSIEGSSGVTAQQIDDADMLMQSRQAIAESARQQYELAKLGPRIEQIDAQRAIVRQLEGALSNAMIDLNNTVIRSPIAGTVLARNVELGEFVTTGFVGDRGAKGYVLSIADLTDLRVELDVSQNDFAKVSARQPCWIVTDAYPDKKYEGVVDLISPEANRQKATVQVRVKVLNPDDLLKPDMNATVSFLSRHAPTSEPANDRPVFRVPSTAVRDGAVFVVENGKALRRAVQTVKDAGPDIQINSGLIGGEDLIVSPPTTLEDGAKVKATAEVEK
jgi:HlyD family secretion protein